MRPQALVAHSDEALRCAYALSLARSGYVVAAADTAALALNRISKSHSTFDLAIVGPHLCRANCDGSTLVEKIRSHSPTCILMIAFQHNGSENDLDGFPLVAKTANAEKPDADRMGILVAVRTVLNAVTETTKSRSTRRKWIAVLAALGLVQKDLQNVLQLERSTVRDHLASLHRLGMRSPRDALRRAVEVGGGNLRGLLKEFIDDPSVIERAAHALGESLDG